MHKKGAEEGVSTGVGSGISILKRVKDTLNTGRLAKDGVMSWEVISRD
jgi:hypothetical protein